MSESIQTTVNQFSLFQFIEYCVVHTPLQKREWKYFLSFLLLTVRHKDTAVCQMHTFGLTRWQR
jgi:hypothetical protein